MKGSKKADLVVSDEDAVKMAAADVAGGCAQGLPGHLCLEVNGFARIVDGVRGCRLVATSGAPPVVKSAIPVQTGSKVRA